MKFRIRKKNKFHESERKIFDYVSPCWIYIFNIAIVLSWRYSKIKKVDSI